MKGTVLVKPEKEPLLHKKKLYEDSLVSLYHMADQ